MSALPEPTAIRHHPDCVCKPCMIEAFRQVVDEVVAERMPPAPETAMSIADVVEASSLSEWTIRRLIESGDLPVLRIGKAVKVRRSDFEALLQRLVDNPMAEVPQVTREHVLEAANRHLAKAGRPPLTMRQYQRAVRICRFHGLVSGENLDWARRGYRPDPTAVAR